MIRVGLYVTTISVGAFVHGLLGALWVLWSILVFEGVVATVRMWHATRRMRSGRLRWALAPCVLLAAYFYPWRVDHITAHSMSELRARSEEVRWSLQR